MHTITILVHIICVKYSLTFPAHSPMLGHITSSMEGLHTIRAFCSQEVVTEQFDGHYNFYLGCWFCDVMMFCWFMLRTNLSTAVFAMAVIFTCLLTRNSK